MAGLEQIIGLTVLGEIGLCSVKGLTLLYINLTEGYDNSEKRGIMNPPPPEEIEGEKKFLMFAVLPFPLDFAYLIYHGAKEIAQDVKKAYKEVFEKLRDPDFSLKRYLTTE